MHSKDILKNALLQYNGTLIIVSHDRDFLQGLTNKVFEFKNGNIREYLGDIYDFLEARRIYTLKQLEINQQKEGKNESVPLISLNKLNREKQRNFDKELRRIRNLIEKSELRIHMLEDEIRKKEEILGDPLKFKEDLKSGNVFEEYGNLKKQLETELERWERLSAEMEVFEKQKNGQV